MHKTRILLATVIATVIGFGFYGIYDQNNPHYAPIKQPFIFFHHTPADLNRAEPPGVRIGLSTSVTRERRVMDIDYASYASIISAFATEAAEMLEAYKTRELKAETDAESQYALTGLLKECTFPSRISSQDDLDLAMSDSQPPELTYPANDFTIWFLERLARCAELNQYLAGTDLLEAYSTNMQLARDNGHPMATLKSLPLDRVNSGEISTDEIYSTFANAYDYSADKPEDRLEVLDAALDILRPATTEHGPNIDYTALALNRIKQSLFDREPVQAQRIVDFVISEGRLPIEATMLRKKADSFAQAMEDGDWSFLNGGDGT
jgi:hypothetical protein